MSEWYDMDENLGIPAGLLVLMPRGYGRMLFKAYHGLTDAIIIRTRCTTYTAWINYLIGDE